MVILGGAFLAVYWLISILLGVFINAGILKLSMRVVCQRRYHFRDACGVSLKVVLLIAALQLGSGLITMALPDFDLAISILTIVLIFIVSAVLYGRLIQSRRGGAIGMKRGFLIQLVQTGICLLIMAPFIVIGIIIGMSSESLA